MDATVVFLLAVLLACCVIPMLMMRRRRHHETRTSGPAPSGASDTYSEQTRQTGAPPR